MITASHSLSRQYLWRGVLSFLGRLALVLLTLAVGLIAIGFIEQYSWSLPGTLQLLALMVMVALVYLALTWARLSAVRLVRWLGIDAPAGTNCPPTLPVYPLELNLNGQLLRLSFLDGYVTMLAASQEEILASQNYVLATAALLQARDAAENSGARFTLVYIPSKAHVYLPLAADVVAHYLDEFPLTDD